MKEGQREGEEEEEEEERGGENAEAAAVMLCPFPLLLLSSCNCDGL